MKTNTFYHVTSEANLSSILENGLIPQRGERAKECEPDGFEAVFLFRSEEDVNNAWWLWECFEDDEVPVIILKIALPNTFKTVNVAFEAQCSCVIPPEHIVAIRREEVESWEPVVHSK